MATLKLQQKKYFSEQNMRKIISTLVGLMSSVSALEDQCIKEYDETKTYQKGQIVVGSDGYFYEAVTVTNGVFDSSKWTKIGTDSFTELSKEEVENLLNLTPEQITTLSSIILDSEVRLDKTYSSSKIYQDIQQCLNDSKAFTLLELGKFSGASYKVVASTSEMTSESIIYLLASGNTYDMYIVEENGATTKIGDMDIDLSQYYTKTEIDNDFLKKADADGKYATITTVDGKIDKDKIVTVLDDSATDEQVYSAKVMNTELDGIVKKTDISTTIDSSSTDDTVPTTKAVYDKVNSVVVSQITTSFDSGTIEDYLETLTPNVDVLFVSNYTTGELVTLTKEHLFMIEYRKAGNSLYLQRAYQAKDGKLIACRSKNWWNGTWSKWNLVCTTKVADVSKTNIAFMNTTNFSTMPTVPLSYVVKNGLCTISGGVTCNASASTAVTISESMPVPSAISYGVGINTDNPSDQILVVLAENVNGQNVSALKLKFGTAGSNYRVTFTYPVAE